MILNLISGPRNISTALMYSFAQRTDTLVVDEPFYAFYLSRSGIHHPGKEEVLESQPADEHEVTATLFSTTDKPVVFVKNMAHHLALMDQSFPDKVTNIFLIRSPKQIISSYAQVIEAPTLADIGIEYQYTLFNTLKDKGRVPVVLDSGLLLENPESVLRQACLHVGIPFESSMLRWQPGPKPYDGVWAKYWYSNVHRSAGFEKQPTSNRPLPDHLVPLTEKAEFYYQRLLPFSVQP
jgi:Sulfotransferase domain